jgi:(E)-4-hydroxy-3-methylbut-2-enyl-diphosphate synthase
MTGYSRLKTMEVKIGDLLLGNNHPIRVQTMTTTDTMDTIGTVEQTIRCIEAGAEMVRITAPSKKEAENLLNIKNELRKRGYTTPLVADIHFTPNAAEIAARIIEKVRVNPGNYVDKKKFEFIEYTDADYVEEIDRIRERFTPLVKICKEYGTAMRIGTNHGSLSDRIMSRYGDTANGMVESAMEFLRIARFEDYHNIVLSMKSSNPQVMVQAYRLLVQTMQHEFGVIYPLHLGVTEAGDGEDGRIKSAIGIGTLLEDGIGDTIRVSLTEDPEFEIPVCKDLVKRYTERSSGNAVKEDNFLNEEISLTADSNTSIKERKSIEESIPSIDTSNLPYSPFEYRRRETVPVGNIGGKQVPVVVADFMFHSNITERDLEPAGYKYDAATDKWNIGDAAADLVYVGKQIPTFALPGTLKFLVDYEVIRSDVHQFEQVVPLIQYKNLSEDIQFSKVLNVLAYDCNDVEAADKVKSFLKKHSGIVPALYSSNPHAMPSVRRFIIELMNEGIKNPVILAVESQDATIDEQLIHFSTEAGALFLDGMGDGIWLMNDPSKLVNQKVSGRTYLPTNNNNQFINNTSFSILQATRTRVSKTEYISCPSCGRTLFDLQETTAKIRSVTNHLKGVKIAIMGCIVNGPGEMADADFGYVGSGPGKITLYKGKEVVKKSVNSEVAVDELINLLKESGAWVNVPQE